MICILVIDDDKSVRIAIETLLRHEGCVTVLADGGRLGVEAFKASRFDVVMVDIFMPDVDGIEIIKVVREQEPTLPIIAMSGFRFRGSAPSSPDFLAMAEKLGATYCLRKPFGPHQLMDAIGACLR